MSDEVDWSGGHDGNIIRFFATYGPTILLMAHPLAFVYLALGAEPLPFAGVAAIEALIFGALTAITWPYSERDENATREVEWDLDGFDARWRVCPAAAGEEPAGPAFVLGFLAILGGVFWIPTAMWVHPQLTGEPFGPLLFFALVLTVPLAVVHFSVVWVLRAIVNGVRSGPTVSVSVRARRLQVDGEDWDRSARDRVDVRSGELVIRNGGRSIRVRGGVEALKFLAAELVKTRPEPEVRDVPEALEAMR